VNVSSTAGSLSDMAASVDSFGGFVAPAYAASKAALNSVTISLAQELRPRGILVNATCPGWVRTDMGGSGAPRSPEEGADTAIWLATLPDDGPTGGFFHDRRPTPW
jgi:NAD(P)-dependent dehydrogenase (short-subunit alcohol dehydrogenase family)